MRLLILGEHELERWKEIKEKAARIFGQPLPGVRILHRYATLSGNRTFTVIETAQEEGVAKLMTELSGVSQYEIYPIYEIGVEGQEEVREEPFDSMHGPI